MSDYFIFGGVDTRTFNAAVYRQNVETVGPQLYKVYEVPGRNGDILLPEGRYPNRQERYNILITGTNAAQNMDDLKNALLAITGYARLEDSFDTDVFYSAALLDNFDIVYDRERTAAKCLLVFNRKPQRFLKTGEEYISAGICTNPTLYTSKPLIRATGIGTIRWRQRITDEAHIITISDVDVTDDTFIDCETMECYGGDPITNRNSNVIIEDYIFPYLLPGINRINISGLSALSFMPRWWKL